MRNLSDVIDKILEIVPPEETRLIARLNAAKTSSLFAAPEMQLSFWRKAASALAGCDTITGKEPPEWVAKVLDIVLDIWIGES